MWSRSVKLAFSVQLHQCGRVFPGARRVASVQDRTGRPALAAI
jgi:hypothetical protein